MNIRKYLLPLVAFLLAFAAPRAVRADAVTYDFNGTLADGNTVSGQFTLDVSLVDSGNNGFVSFDFKIPNSSIDITPANFSPRIFTYTSLPTYPPEVFTQFTFDHFYIFNKDSLVLWFEGPLASFDGGPIVIGGLPGGIPYGDPDLPAESFLDCSDSPTFTFNCNNYVAFTSGSAVRATATPEPSVLLQSGVGLLLGFALVVFWGKQSFAAART